MAAQDAFGANTLLLSSASSKTAFATAFCLTQRPGRRNRIVGLTSTANAGFARSLGCYDEVLGGRHALAGTRFGRGAAQAQAGAVLRAHACAAAGRTAARELWPQRPAATHRRRLGGVHAAGDGCTAAPWLRIEHGQGEDAVRAMYQQVLQGRGDPRVGHMLAL